MPWLSLPDYSRRTGTPESTVRAAIRKGTVRGELEPRAPGDPRTVWKVWLDDPQEQPQMHPQASAEPRVATESDQPPAAITEPPAAIAGLLELIAADRETITSQAEQIAELRERVGRAESERDLLRAEVDRLRRRPWWRLW